MNQELFNYIQICNGAAKLWAGINAKHRTDGKKKWKGTWQLNFAYILILMSWHLKIQ